MARDSIDTEASSAPGGGGPGRFVTTVGQLICQSVIRAPWAWPLLRGRVMRYFGQLAAGWDERTGAGGPDHLATLAAAALRVKPAPERVLDLGCGTGAGTLFLAREFPTARIRGLDLSAEMIDAAVAKTGLDPEGRVAFRVGDASHLPFEADSFDLVAQVNMPVFAAEIVRVLRPGGHLIVASSSGAATPFHTPEGTVARAMSRRGLETVEIGAAGRGSFYVGRLPG